MLRVRAAGSGWEGGPGVSTFYFTAAAEDGAAATQCVERVQAFLVGIKGIWPFRAGWTVQPLTDVIDPVTGNVTATLSSSVAPPGVTGEGSAQIASPALAALLKWSTSTFNAGRRVRGQTFLSPLAGTKVTGEGTLDPTASSAINTAAAGLANVGVSPPLLVIWHRPIYSPKGTVPRVLLRPGSTAEVTAHSVPSKIATLRSRRD